MSYTQWLGRSMAHDVRVCIHLFEKIPSSLHAWRPSEKQRSVDELLRYLAFSPISALKGFREPERGWRDHYQAKAKSLSLSDFPAAMEDQAREIEAYFADLPEELLESLQVKMPWGEILPLGYAIVNGPAKWLPAYKMQLFLYGRQNGIQMVTSNLWRGVEPVSA